MTVFWYLISFSMDLYNCIFSFFSLVYLLGSIEKIYQPLKTVFGHIYEYLKVCQKYFDSAWRIFNSLSVFESAVKHGL